MLICRDQKVSTRQLGGRSEMTVHIGFVKLSATVTTDDNISSYVTEAKVTVHMGHF